MNGSQVRFRPRLEALDGRAMPSTLTGWEVMDAGVAVVQQAESPKGEAAGGIVSPTGGMAGGVLGDSWKLQLGLTANRNAGEEIPQSVAVGGIVNQPTPTGGMAGGVLGDSWKLQLGLTANRNAGEEIPS